ncbi:MAG: response regulator [Chitinophagaceae bacterium]|nr:MAG: response regulator [Chitinophagaceae bacterium]
MDSAMAGLFRRNLSAGAWVILFKFEMQRPPGPCFSPFDPEEPMKHPNLTHSHLVLVDDDVDACLLFERALHKVDPLLPFTALHSGEALLAEWPLLKAGILFLDLTLPGKSGLECLAALRADSRYERVPIIVYSNSVRMTDISKAYEKSANLFIVKPFSQHHLVNALGHVLEMDWTQDCRDRYFINNQFVPFTAGSCLA